MEKAHTTWLDDDDDEMGLVTIWFDVAGIDINCVIGFSRT